MDDKNVFLLVFLVLGAIFAFYGNFVASQVLLYLGVGLIIGVAGIFGITVQNQIIQVQNELSELLTLQKK